MVKHIILWTLNPELTDEQRVSIKSDIKQGLEGLASEIEGVIDITVQIDGRLASSNADLMLDSTFANEDALRHYATHPSHLQIANERVRPYTIQRSCLDYEI
ncbi:MAG: Dabb family protein [Bacteroidaceae bacterium]|nr:Dabb family protein [Bacteroidaceae bacterium]